MQRGLGIHVFTLGWGLHELFHFQPGRGLEDFFQGNFLEAILFAYSFMVAGLFVPTMGAFFWRRSSRTGALWGMLSGGVLTLLMMIGMVELPSWIIVPGLDATAYGIGLSAFVFITLSLLIPDSRDESMEVPESVV